MPAAISPAAAFGDHLSDYFSRFAEALEHALPPAAQDPPPPIGPAHEAFVGRFEATVLQHPQQWRSRKQGAVIRRQQFRGFPG